MDDECDNCKRPFPPSSIPAWNGYQWLCRECADAYWNDDDGRLDDLRLGRVGNS
jgi:hypothetical protein